MSDKDKMKLTARERQSERMNDNVMT